MRTIIPFFEPIRLDNVKVIDEFLEEINKASKRHGIPPEKWGAKYELSYLEETGWFVNAEIWTDEPVDKPDKS